MAGYKRLIASARLDGEMPVTEERLLYFQSVLPAVLEGCIRCWVHECSDVLKPVPNIVLEFDGEIMLGSTFDVSAHYMGG